MAAQPMDFPSLLDSLRTDPKGALSESTVQQEMLAQGNFINVVRDTVVLPNGRHATREYVKHPGAVVVVPILDDGRLLVLRQYRHPIGHMLVEFPAGKLDDQEPHLACGARELTEETGLHARQWAYAGVMHNCIGYSDEFIAIYFAKDMQQRQQALEEGELIHLYAASLDELMACMRDGSLTDAKTITCLAWLQQMQAGLWQPQWQTLQEPAA